MMKTRTKPESGGGKRERGRARREDRKASESGESRWRSRVSVGGNARLRTERAEPTAPCSNTHHL